MGDAVTDILQAKIEQAKVVVLQVAKPSAKLNCLGCGAPLKHPSGWIPIRRFRALVEQGCKQKGLEWQRKVGAATIIHLAISELMDRGTMEYEYSSGRIRLVTGR